jgi:hypothetical protein
MKRRFAEIDDENDNLDKPNTDATVEVAENFKPKKLNILQTMNELALPFRNIGRYFVCPEETKALMSGELHAPCANYAGPGTHYKMRAERGDKPTSNGDAAAMAHDKAFNEVSTGLRNKTMSKEEAIKKVRLADEAMLETIRTLNRDNPEGNKLFTSMSKQLIASKIALEEFGLLDPTKFVT